MPAGQVNSGHVTVPTCSTPTCWNKSPVVSTKTDPETIWDGYLFNWGLFHNLLTRLSSLPIVITFRGAPFVSGDPLGIRHPNVHSNPRRTLYSRTWSHLELGSMDWMPPSPLMKR